MRRFASVALMIIGFSAALFAAQPCGPGQGNQTPENPTAILGMLGAAGLTWQYFRGRK